MQHARDITPGCLGDARQLRLLGATENCPIDNFCEPANKAVAALHLKQTFKDPCVRFRRRPDHVNPFPRP